MINLYKLLNTLEQGMSLFQLNKWKTEGIWYPILQYKKESNEIQVVTNVFVSDQETYHIQLTGNYLDDEIKDWVTFLEATNGTNHNNKRIPNRMRMARQSTSRRLYLAN